MKRIKITLSVIAVALLLPMTSCKKGENDPVSLKSRTKRLAGVWNLGTSSSTSTSVSGDETWTTVTTFNGTDQTSYQLYNDGTTVDTIWGPNTDSYAMEIEFTKDGEFEMTQTSGGSTDITKGYWYWSGKDKSKNLKKKEAVMMVITEQNSGGGVSTYSGSAPGIDWSYQLDRLAKDELITIRNESATYSDGSTYTTEETMEFTKE